MELMYTYNAYDLSELNNEQLNIVYKKNKQYMFINFNEFKLLSEDCLFTFDCYESSCYPTFRSKEAVRDKEVINALKLFKE